MTVVSGIDGSIARESGGTLYTTCVRNWTVEFEIEDVNTTCLTDDWQVHQYGIGGWSGSYEALWDSTTGDTNLELGIANTAAVDIDLKVRDSGTTVAVQGTVWLTGWAFNVGTGDGPDTVTVSFVGSGTPTIGVVA